MSVRLIKEVLRYTAANPKLSTSERLVLFLIAERARPAAREAYAGDDGWNLATVSGMAPSTLRGVLQRLAGHGLEVRVPRSTDSSGRPVYASWNRQTTYRLPTLPGDGNPSPMNGTLGDEIPSPDDLPVGDEQGALGDEIQALGDGIPSPYPEVTKDQPKPVGVDLRTDTSRTRPASGTQIDPKPTPLRVIPGTGPPSQPVATQPALWPAAVREEPAVTRTEARQTARGAIQAATLAKATKMARQDARGQLAPLDAPVPSTSHPPGPTCSACGAELDPDRTCFVCRDGRIQVAS
jgi:hypothetical protein